MTQTHVAVPANEMRFETVEVCPFYRGLTFSSGHR
jgi:hypothetical protein